MAYFIFIPLSALMFFYKNIDFNHSNLCITSFNHYLTGQKRQHTEVKRNYLCFPFISEK